MMSARIPLAILATFGVCLGCAAGYVDEGDATVPHDSSAPVDAGSDSRAEPVACVPAACDAADGGTDAYQPPWGCPEACDPGCVGDTVCCEDGTCQPRTLHACDDGCDVELTVRSPVSVPQCGSNPEMWADVCNRGTTLEASAGQVVRFEGEHGTWCEAVTTAPIPPCSCVRASCDFLLWSGSFVTPLLNPDAPLPDCGSPWGHIGGVTGYAASCE
jgi:hypothetical protein